MKSMHSLILILSLTLSLVVCPTPNTEISYDEEPNFTALPNEFPELSSFYLRFDETTQKNLLELKNVIGYLPFNEQIALMKSIQGTSGPNLFDYSTYESYIKTSTGSIFDAQAKAIGDYIAQQEKTLSYGIGCLKAVSNKYASKSEYNQQMQSVIYNSIDNILNAQSLNNQCQAEFLTALQKISIKKRAYLFSIQKASNKIQQNTDIFEYKDDAPSILIDAYKKFAFCQNVYTNILATSSMKAEIALANMDGCKDYDNPNNNAGNSSDVYDNPSIEYRKNDKQKGINNGNLVRSDQKTFNGYLLNHGFNLGKATYNNNYRISSEYNTLIENVLNDFSDNGVRTIIGDIKEQLLDYKPFSGLVENYIDILFDTTNGCISAFINDYKNECTSKSYSIRCPNSSPCTIDPGTRTTCTTTLKTFPNNNLQFTSFELYGQCPTTPGKMTVVAKAEHPLLGNVFDIQYNGERVGAKTISTIQACMASFSSGGSNDKDACRDVITKKCGMNIDYQCKKSGFYDYINANPNSVPLPPQCSLPTSNACFEWIETYFFAGHFVVKPSAFVGYNLYLSTASNGKADNLKSLDYIAPNYRNGNTRNIDVVNGLDGLISNIPKIEILGTTEISQADISEKTVLMDKGTYKILHDGSKSLSFGFIVILLNIVLLL